MTHSRRLSGLRGFSLIELLIVVAIIAILAEIALVYGLRAMNRSKQSRAMADMKTMFTGMRGGASPQGGFNLKDPWGNPYDIDDRHGHLTIRCFGKDGLPSAGISFETRDEFDLDIVLEDGSFIHAPVN